MGKRGGAEHRRPVERERDLLDGERLRALAPCVPAHRGTAHHREGGHEVERAAGVAEDDVLQPLAIACDRTERGACLGERPVHHRFAPTGARRWPCRAPGAGGAPEGESGCQAGSSGSAAATPASSASSRELAGSAAGPGGDSDGGGASGSGRAFSSGRGSCTTALAACSAISVASRSSRVGPRVPRREVSRAETGVP